MCVCLREFQDHYWTRTRQAARGCRQNETKNVHASLVYALSRMPRTETTNKFYVILRVSKCAVHSSCRSHSRCLPSHLPTMNSTEKVISHINLNWATPSISFASSAVSSVNRERIWICQPWFTHAVICYMTSLSMNRRIGIFLLTTVLLLIIFFIPALLLKYHVMSYTFHIRAYVVGVRVPISHNVNCIHTFCGRSHSVAVSPQSVNDVVNNESTKWVKQIKNNKKWHNSLGL